MSTQTVSLAALPEGGSAQVLDLLCRGSIRRRLQDMGIIQGTHIQCLQRSPAGDPIAYRVRGATIALRLEDSRDILVQTLESVSSL